MKKLMYIKFKIPILCKKYADDKWGYTEIMFAKMMKAKDNKLKIPKLCKKYIKLDATRLYQE